MLLPARAIARQTDRMAKKTARSVSLAKLARDVGVSVRVLKDNFERGCPRGSADAIREWRSQHVPIGGDESVAALELLRLTEEVTQLRLSNDERRRRLKMQPVAAEICELRRTGFDSFLTSAAGWIDAHAKLMTARAQREAAEEANARERGALSRMQREDYERRRAAETR